MGCRCGLPSLFINREAGEAEATDQLVAMAEAADITVERLSSVRFRKERGGKLSRPGEALQPWRIEYDEAVAGILGRYDIRCRRYVRIHAYRDRAAVFAIHVHQ